MKNYKILPTLLFASMISLAQNGSYFEYKVSSTNGITGSTTIKYSEYGMTSSMNMSSPKMPGGSMTMSTLKKNDDKETLYMINDKNKTYSKSKRNSAGGHHEDNNTYTVKKIGNETINGYKCVHAIVTSSNTTSEVWNTKDIPDYAKYEEAINSNERMGSSKRQQALKDAGCEGFPVKMINKGNEREGEMTMELVKLEKKSYSKSDFEIPAGYTESGNAAAPAGVPQMKSQDEIMKMTPEERQKYIEEMKKQYGKGH
jgi:hypothetical protein